MSFVNKDTVEKEIKNIKKTVCDTYGVFIEDGYAEVTLAINSNVKGDKLELNIDSWKQVLAQAERVRDLNQLLELAKKV